MHQLLTPLESAGVAVQCHHGICPAVIARPLAAEEIRAGGAGGRKYQVTRSIHRQRRPGIGGTRGRYPVRAPFLEHRIRRITRNRIPAPLERAAPRVEGPHAAEFLEHRAIVADGRADDHLAVQDRRRRSDEIIAPLVAFLELRAHVVEQIHRAVLAEVRAGLAGGGIQRQQPRIERRSINARVTYRPRRARLVHPQRHAARYAIGIVQILAALAVVAPAQSSVDRIHGDHVGAAGGEIQGAVVENRRGLEGRARPVLHALSEFAGAESPGHPQLTDIGRRDFCQRRIARAALVAAVGRPAAVVRGGRDAADAGE